MAYASVSFVIFNFWFLSPGYPGAHYVAPASLRLGVTLLPQPPESGVTDESHVASELVFLNSCWAGFQAW